ncbi:MAG: hypothetical protein JJ911_04175 [Rhizobiaceae bacterium]|nr:hypothetical protein [Rhizobiaceae bacterium]
MMRAYLKSQFDKFGKRYGYDTGYLKEVVELDVGGATKLGMVASFTAHRFGLAAEPYFAAKVTAARWADCGSCLRLAIAMAVEAGVGRATLSAMLTGEGEAPPDMALASRYAQAVIDNAPELAEIIGECKSRWGREGVAGLSAATVSGLFYPLFKRGFGYGNICEPVLAELKSEARRLSAEAA